MLNLSNSIEDREKQILELVKKKSDRVLYKWEMLKIDQLTLLVISDGLKIDNIRVNVSAYLQQQIADLLNASLLTAKLCDLLWHHSEIKINPSPQQISSSNESMIDHSHRVDKQIEQYKNKGIISTIGKNWIVDNRLLTPKIPNQACNYGWHFTGLSFNGIKGNVNQSLLKNPNTKQYWKVIQPASFHHNFLHSDYSQICVLVSRQCWINGKEKDLFDVLKDPNFASLVNHDGILHVLRQPNVPILNPIIDLPVPPVQSPLPQKSIIELPPTPVSPTSVLPEPEPQDPNSNLPVLTDTNTGGIWALIMNIIKMVFSLFKR